MKDKKPLPRYLDRQTAHIYIKGAKSSIARITVPNVMQSNSVFDMVKLGAYCELDLFVGRSPA